MFFHWMVQLEQSQTSTPKFQRDLKHLSQFVMMLFRSPLWQHQFYLNKVDALHHIAFEISGV